MADKDLNPKVDNNATGPPPPPRNPNLDLAPNRFRDTDFVFEAIIGKGKFGIVEKGSLRMSSKKTIVVASKKLIVSTPESAAALAHESEMMKLVGEHSYIVHGVGLLLNKQNEPASVLMEFVQNGRELKSLLKERVPINWRTKIRFLYELSTAVEHMATIGIVHRDVAARNILVEFVDAKFGRLRLCDFGLAKMVDLTSREYHGQHDNQFPRQWSAPEAIEKRIWSLKSDIWSTMVVAWEVFEPNSPEPCYWIHNFADDEEWLARFRDNPDERLEFSNESADAPVDLIKDISALAMDCWKWNSNERPTAESVRFQFGTMMDKFYSSIALKALCVLKGDLGVKGLIRLEQESADGPTRIIGEIAGLTPGKHGFHVYEFGDNTKGCESAGGHYNPHKKQHGGREDEERHVGDLGNVEADASGNAKIDLLDNMITLNGRHSVIGRAMIVHEKEDDLGTGDDESHESGNAGGSVGFGVISIASTK